MALDTGAMKWYTGRMCGLVHVFHRERERESCLGHYEETSESDGKKIGVKLFSKTWPS